MKYDTKLLKDATELKPVKPEPKPVLPNYNIRFAITGWKVTISKDLYNDLFKDSSHLVFSYQYLNPDKTILNLKGINPEIIGGLVETDNESYKKIHRKGELSDTAHYYYVTLSKGEYNLMDTALSSRKNAIVSRLYTIFEDSISQEDVVAQFNLSNRKKPFFKAGYANGKSPAQRKKAKEVKKAEEEAIKLALEEEKARLKEAGKSKKTNSKK